MKSHLLFNWTSKKLGKKTLSAYHPFKILQIPKGSLWHFLFSIDKLIPSCISLNGFAFHIFESDEDEAVLPTKS